MINRRLAPRHHRRMLAFALVTGFVGMASMASAAWQVNGNPVANTTGNKLSPNIVSAFDGGGIVLWTDYRNGNPDLYAQRFDSTGVWLWDPAGVPVCTNPSNQALGAKFGIFGGAAYVWRDDRVPAGMYAQQIDPNGTALMTAGGTYLGGVPNELAAGMIPDGVLATGKPLGYIAGWSEGTVPDMRFVHFDATAGVSWTTVYPEASGEMSMAIDGVGGFATRKGAIVAYSRDQGGYDIIAFRLRGLDGALLNTTAICNAPGDQRSPQVVNVGNAKTVMAWLDLRDDDGSYTKFDLYCQKVDSSLTTLWTPNGVPMCRATGSQIELQIVSDGSGGIYAVWQDNRSSPAQIYAQHIDTAGQPLWGADGIAVAPANDTQDVPTLIGVQDGVVIAWHDIRGGDSGIDAQKLDPGGNRLWTTSGIVVAPTGVGSGPLMATDAYYGALISWSDDHTGVEDSYVTRLWSGSPLLLAAPVSTAAPLALQFVSANPARADVALRLDLPEAENVRLEVIDIVGRRVRRLQHGRLDAGEHEVRWDGRDDEGARIAPGVYFVRAATDHGTRNARVVYLR